MGKKPTRETFAQMVRGLPETVDVVPPRIASLDGDTLVDESGLEYTCVEEDLPNARVGTGQGGRPSSHRRLWLRWRVRLDVG